MTPQAARARAREDDRQHHPVVPGAPQVHAAAAQVLRLQQTAGNAAVGRALTRSPGRVVSRLRLNASQVLSKVESIDFMKAKLGASLRGEAMRDQVQRTLTKYEAMHGDKHRGATSTGVMLAMTLEGVARMIAQELYDPALQSSLATKLLELYETEIKAATGLGKDKQGAESLALAKVLVADDPLALYMHKEMRLEVAVARIRKMATDTRRTPERMFALLRHKWEAQMAAQDRAKIKAAEPPTTAAYQIKESTGEISAAYLEKLFGSGPTAPEKPGGKGLVFTADAQQRLDALRAKVSTPDPAVDMGGFVPRHAGMTAKQERHLQEIEARETDQVKDDARARLAAKISEALGIPSGRATAMAADIETWLKTVPLTITVWGSRWFDAGVPAHGRTAFRPATKDKKTAKVETIFNKPGAAGDIEYTGKYEDPVYGKERGENYLRFRTWKDRLMTGLLDFDPAEMPVFGAANLHWDSNRGTLEGDKRKEGGDINAGENYYGDTHFVLRDAIRNRVIYTATDHGPPRREPLLAVLDFVTSGGGLTGLGATKPGMLLEVIDAARTRQSNIKAALPFEIQVFGGVDIASDLKAIHYAPGLPAHVKQNIVQFCTALGLATEQIAPTDRGTLVEASGVDGKKVATRIREVLHGEAVDPDALETLTVNRREMAVRVIGALRFQVLNDQDFDVLKKELAAIDALSFDVPPELLGKFKDYKAYVDAYQPSG